LLLSSQLIRLVFGAKATLPPVIEDEPMNDFSLQSRVIWLKVAPTQRSICEHAARQVSRQVRPCSWCQLGSQRSPPRRSSHRMGYIYLEVGSVQFEPLTWGQSKSSFGEPKGVKTGRLRAIEDASATQSIETACMVSF